MEALIGALGEQVAQSDFDVQQVYLQHGAFLWQTLARLGVREADLDDALQDILMIVHRRLDSYDPKRAALRTWLFGIAVKVSQAYHRRSRSRREVFEAPPDTDGKHGDAATQAVEEATPEVELERQRARAELGRMLDSLTPVKRATFVMFELEGLCCETIADIMGVPVGTVHSRLNAARRDFRRAFRRLVKREQGAL